MYGHLEGDEQMRVLLIRSEDDGLTWNFVSTIAEVGTSGKRGNYEVGYEGFCEPVMTRARDGSLLVVMRTGGYDPMFQTRSFAAPSAASAAEASSLSRRSFIAGASTVGATVASAAIIASEGTAHAHRRRSDGLIPS